MTISESKILEILESMNETSDKIIKLLTKIEERLDKYDKA